jgi:hypothetical protein
LFHYGHRFGYDVGSSSDNMAGQQTTRSFMEYMAADVISEEPAANGGIILLRSTYLTAVKAFRLLGVAVGCHAADLERVWSEFGVLFTPRRNRLHQLKCVQTLKVKYGARQELETNASRFTLSQIVKPGSAAIAEAEVAPTDTCTEQVAQNRGGSARSPVSAVVEWAEGEDEILGDISRTEDSVRDEITSTLIDIEECMEAELNNEVRLQIEEGTDNHIEASSEQALTIDWGNTLRTQDVAAIQLYSHARHERNSSSVGRSTARLIDVLDTSIYEVMAREKYEDGDDM